MLKGLNDFMDKHEGREVGSSTKAILKERKHQGYDKGAKHKALEHKVTDKSDKYKRSLGRDAQLALGAKRLKTSKYDEFGRQK